MTDNNRQPLAAVTTRRKALQCMALAGSGIVWTMSGGAPVAVAKLGEAGARLPKHGLLFAQISDTHLGFSGPANPDVALSLETSIARIKALPRPPAFLLHTGDITHRAKPEEFDAADGLIRAAGMETHYVPGEHDVEDQEHGGLYRERYARTAKGDGWYSFDQSGVHFIALVNVMRFSDIGLGALGAEQLAWLVDDLSALRDSTPIIVFAHVPLWAVYPDWGWATADSAEALKLLRRFGSVTVLNGHIHQTLQKIEGDVAFYTAASTAFPQPAPGSAPRPGPKALPAAELPSALGIRSITVKRNEAIIADFNLAQS